MELKSDIEFYSEAWGEINVKLKGTFFDTLTIVTWESNQLKMPEWNADTDKIASEYDWDEDD